MAAPAYTPRFSPGDRVVLKTKRRSGKGEVLAYRLDEDEIGRNFDEQITVAVEGFGPCTFRSRSMGGRSSDTWSAKTRRWPFGSVRITKEPA